MTERPYRVLLVEDNPGDVMLIEEALLAANIPVQITRCETINSAVKTVLHYSADDANVPDLLMLDYNLPGGEAREVLQAAIANRALVSTKKAVITSSMSVRDRQDALRCGAECVISKPADLDSFLKEVGNAVSKLLARNTT